MKPLRRPFLLSALAAVLAGTCLFGGAGRAEDAADATRNGPLAAVRREVRMLDDIYKGGIVTITDNYVNDAETIPAGTAFKKLFEYVEQKGWHRVRLVDATGEPYNDENVAEDDFETAAIAQLLEGEDWVEQVEERDGKRYFRVATPIPVVLSKCVMCHDNYEEVPAGRAVGALTYSIPLDGRVETE